MPMAANSVRKVVNEAIAGSNLIEFRYKKKNKRFVTRRAEPYEIKTESALDDYGFLKQVTYVYAYDVTPRVRVKDRSTKKWIINQFEWIRVVDNKTFDPRY